MSELNIVV